MKDEYYTKYFSKNPNIKESFDTVEELKSAEAAYDARIAEEEAKKKTRKEDYEAVEAAYRLAAEKQEEANKAYDEACAIKNRFVEKYGSLHLTVKMPNYGHRSMLSDILNDLFTF